jgi:hypothetical protein
MAFSAEDLLPRAREAARQVVAALDGNQLVLRWAESYAKQQKRQVLPAETAEARERLAALNREALLAICACLHSELPRKIAGKRITQLSGFHAAAADAFRAEFYLHLAKAMGWDSAELDEFWRDMDRYHEFASHQRGRGRGTFPSAAIAFLDRFAILLDSSRFEQARRSVIEFLPELERAASAALRAAFRKRA